MSIKDTEKVANIFTDKKEKLIGFKIMGVFPFYLSFIRLPVHIELCLLQEKIQALKGDEVEASMNDFYDAELLKKITPLLYEYCTIGLINNRVIGFLLYPFIKRKVAQCSIRQVHGMYRKIKELSDPAFFFDIWMHLMKKNHIILKTDTALSGK